jgi:CheY-like chemotaxis protein
MAKTILIVDDDPAVVQFLDDLFKDAGYETVIAYNGAEGLAKVKAEKIDFITLDMDMPEKGGTMFYAGLRKEEGLKDTPLVVISGVGPRPPVLKKEIPTLSKPVEPKALLDLVQSCLG